MLEICIPNMQLPHEFAAEMGNPWHEAGLEQADQRGCDAGVTPETMVGLLRA
jgi:hypothetical protein